MASYRVVVATLLTFGSCSANVVFLEHLIKFSPRCGDMIAFAQFLFIWCYGFASTAKCGFVKPVVPVKKYLLVVVLFYSSTVTGNLALGCHITMPLQMVFKSGSVLASLCLGVLILKRSYTLAKYTAVIMITIGISTCMVASSKHSEGLADNQKSAQDQMIWFFGIFLLVSSLFLAAGLGVAQESISLEFGKHPDELLFYSHLLALPGFLMFAPNIIKQIKAFSSSELYSIPYSPIPVPTAWLYLGINVLTSLVCTRSVYVLVTEISALSLTVILTLRKFFSLMISIFYFKNPFTSYHWFGTILVFSGTLLFSGVIEAFIKEIRSPVEKENNNNKEGIDLKV